MNLPRRLHFIIATLVTVAILTLLAIIIVSYTKQRLSSEVIKRYLDQEGVVALQIAEAAQNDLETSHSFLSALSNLATIYSGTTDACNAQLKRAIPFLPKHISRVSRLNAKGIVTCSTDSTIVGLNMTIFDKAVNKIIADPDHKAVIGELSVPPGGEEYTIGYYVPIRDEEGDFVGALKAGTKIETIRAQYEENPVFRRTGKPILIDDTGSVLYSADNDLLNRNIKEEEITSTLIDKNTLLQILEVSPTRQIGNLTYELNGKEHMAIHRRIDILPGHSWTLILATVTEDIQEELLSDMYRLVKILMVGNIVVVLLFILLFILYITHRIIRPEAAVSAKHEEHMKSDITNINQAFGKVTENLGKIEEHLAKDIDALRSEAEKKAAKKSGKKP